MKVLLTGANGTLARALIPRLRSAGHDVLALSRVELDVTDLAAVRAIIWKERPATVVQCAAYTAVDRAEEDDGMAFRLNADATGAVAESCRKVGALLVFPSSDYVFCGTADRPYLPEDPTGPLNVYGRSKVAGEQAALTAGRTLVVRTAGLYADGGSSFVETIINLSDDVTLLEVVNDQQVRPTWVKNLAETLVEMIRGEAEGLFHATDSGEPATWFEIAREIVLFRGSAAKVAPVTQEQLARPALRPLYSVLDCKSTENLLGRELPNWRDSLRTHLLARRELLSTA